MSRTSFTGDALRGLIAGMAAVYALDKLDQYLYDHQGAAARRQTVAARPGGMDPAHVIANRAAEAVGTSLSPQQPHPAGIAVHYGLGGVMGALYSVLRARIGVASVGAGVPFGLAMFLAQDEGLNTMMGTAGKPKDYPWQDHARGAVSHGFFGFVTELLLRVLGGYRPRA